MKLAWLTDIHLNFLDRDKRQKFYEKIVKTECNGLLISGDIAEAPSLESILQEMAEFINKPIYYVLGNHDYYRGQVEQVRDTMEFLTKQHETLFWLPAAGLQQLNTETILIGVDGWADGRLGDYYHATVSMNDSRMIADLFQQKILGMEPLLEKMQQLADVDAQELKRQLNQAIAKNPKKIIVVTHVPPFREASTYKGKISDDGHLPFFTCKAIGDVLIESAAKNNAIEFLVLCGHTHGKALYQPLNNLIVKAGAAEYYKPGVQEVINIEAA